MGQPWCPCWRALLLCSTLLLLLRKGCTGLTYGDLEDEISYLYMYDEVEPFEEETQVADCGDTYYDRLALFCWPKFHAAMVTTTKSNRCFWEAIGSTYGELAICSGLLAKGMGCSWPSPALDTFFMRIHVEYFANCTLLGDTMDATDHQPPAGMVLALTALPICLVPFSVALTLCKA